MGMFSLLEQIFLGYVLSFLKIKIKIYFSNFVGLGHNCLNMANLVLFFSKIIASKVHFFPKKLLIFVAFCIAFYFCPQVPNLGPQKTNF
jgi:hypothetical protein